MSKADEYIDRHARSYGFEVPTHILARHANRIQAWFTDLETWSNQHKMSIAVCPEPIGDPHPPDGLRGAEL